MQNIINNEVLKWFYEISKIPRGSGNMVKIADYCENFAKERNLCCIRDEFNNIIIKKPAAKGYENISPVILQGHLDMVCEKEKGYEIDFLNDPIKLKVEGDFLSAEGTSLGADNGIAVAYIMAVLDSDKISHPPIEAVLTVDEEIGLLGASSIDLSSLNSKRLINIDIEDEGVFTVGCAGGARADITLPVSRESKEGTIYTIEISGLLGGHSGVQIDKNRGNSNVLMGRLLNNLSDVRIISLNGGMKDNVIPSRTTAEIMAENIDDAIELFGQIIKNELRASDGGVTVTFKKEQGSANVTDEKSTKDMIFLLNALPNGILKMSAEIKDLPETSLSMGILNLNQEELKIGYALRSSVESLKTALIEKITVISEYAGAKVEISGIYSGWEYDSNSKLRKTLVSVFKRMYNKEPVVEAIHAGLECGVFCEKIKGLDCISIGPDMYDIHSTDERVSISSVMRTWDFIKEILKELN